MSTVTQVERRRRASEGPAEIGRSVDAFLAIDRCDTGRVAVAVAPGVAAVAESVIHTLEGAGYSVHTVCDLDASDVAEIERCGSVVRDSLS